jgi:hypothetical protein
LKSLSVLLQLRCNSSNKRVRIQGFFVLFLRAPVDRLAFVLGHSEFPAAQKVYIFAVACAFQAQKIRGRESFVHYFYVKKDVRQIDQQRRPLRRNYDLVMVEVLPVWSCFTF